MNPSRMPLTPEETLQLQMRLQQGRNMALNAASSNDRYIASLQSTLLSANGSRTAAPSAALAGHLYANSVNLQPATAPPTMSHLAAQQQLIAPSVRPSTTLDGTKLSPAANGVAVSSNLPSLPVSSTSLPVSSTTDISTSSVSDEKILRLLGMGKKSSGKGSRYKKPKDMPKRPLSAYNLFFKDERERILDSKKDTGGSSKKEKQQDDGNSSFDTATTATPSTSSSSLSSSNDNARPPHGKVGFANLAKIVGSRWKQLSPDRLEHYQRLADEDMDRYKKEMEKYHKVQDAKRKKLEEEQKKEEDEEKRKRKEAQKKIDDELEEARQQVKKRKLAAASYPSHAGATTATTTTKARPSLAQPGGLGFQQAPPASFQSVYSQAGLQDPTAISRAYLQEKQQQQQVAAAAAAAVASNNYGPSALQQQHTQAPPNAQALLLQQLAILRARNNLGGWR